MKYQWILFDADETLFSFNAFLGLKKMLAPYGITFNEQDYQEYQQINRPLWVAYQNKEISAVEIKTRRFASLAKKLGKDPLAVDAEFIQAMTEISQPLENVIETLRHLHRKVKMGIITNGFTDMQKARLQNTQTELFFEFVVVSEQVGVAKPDPRIFEYAITQMGNVDKSQILMVGDTFSSDIVGATAVGIDSCWFNHENHQNETDIRPTYEIKNMLELVDIVKG